MCFHSLHMIQSFQGSGVSWVNVVALGGETEAGVCCCPENWGWVLGLTPQPCPYLMRYSFGPFLPGQSSWLVELNMQCCYKVAGAGKCVSAVSSGFCFSSFSSSSLFSFWSKIVPLGREEGKSNQKQTIDEFC